MSGCLVLVATPIGNLGDTSERAVETLRTADLIACEDTRRTRKLLSHFSISGVPLVSSHEHNEMAMAERIVQRVANGETVALVSDSGTPGVSDPGQRVVAAVAAAGLTVSAVPGASAVLSALVVSGFSTDRFCFEGFLPRSGAERKARLADLAGERRTSVVYESPNRVAKTLSELASIVAGDRRAVVVREFTKLHEEVVRGTVDELARLLSSRELKGECVLVLEGAAVVAPEVTDEQIAESLRKHLGAGKSKKDAAKLVSVELDVPKNRAYEIATNL